MPVPKPNKESESKQEFIQRCISTLADETDDSGNLKYPDNDQRVAICYSQWDRSKEGLKSKDPSKLLKEFYTMDVSAMDFLSGELHEQEKWIQQAVDPEDEGALSRQLGIPEEENIPMSLLNAIIDAEDGETISNPTDTGSSTITVTSKMKQRANFARNVKKSTG